MFELKYTLEDSDLKAINKRIMLFYALLYLGVSLFGLAIGTVAVVFRPQTLMFVLGIILLVFGGSLLLCAVFMFIAPKNYVVSFTPAGEELAVRVKDLCIEVDRPAETVVIAYSDIQKVKRMGGLIVLTVGRNLVFVIKDGALSGGSFDQLTAALKERQGRLTFEQVKEQFASTETQTELEPEPDGATDTEPSEQPEPEERAQEGGVSAE